LADLRRLRIGQRRAQFQLADDRARLPPQSDHPRRARAGLHRIAVAARRAAFVFHD
jgi:hypothetical protein